MKCTCSVFKFLMRVLYESNDFLFSLALAIMRFLGKLHVGGDCTGCANGKSPIKSPESLMMHYVVCF